MVDFRKRFGEHELARISEVIVVNALTKGPDDDSPTPPSDTNKNEQDAISQTTSATESDSPATEAATEADLRTAADTTADVSAASCENSAASEEPANRGKLILITKICRTITSVSWRWMVWSRRTITANSKSDTV